MKEKKKRGVFPTREKKREKIEVGQNSSFEAFVSAQVQILLSYTASKY
jgi:hypothetical protein